jgi:hypothetical protein
MRRLSAADLLLARAFVAAVCERAENPRSRRSVLLHRARASTKASPVSLGTRSHAPFRASTADTALDGGSGNRADVADGESRCEAVRRMTTVMCQYLR